MGSVDVKSLYPSLGHEFVKQQLEPMYEAWEEKTLPTAGFMCLLDICLKYNIIQFNDESFVQVDGTAIGTPPGPEIANCAMIIFDLAIVALLKNN